MEQEIGTYQPSKSPPRNQQMHTNILLLPQIKTQMLSERLDSRFTSIIRRVSRRIRDTLFTSRDDNRRLPNPFPPILERRDVSVQTIDDAVEVCLENLTSVSGYQSEQTNLSRNR